VTGFQNKWSKPPTPGLTERINDALKPKGSLKPRVEMAIRDSKRLFFGDESF